MIKIKDEIMMPCHLAVLELLQISTGNPDVKWVKESGGGTVFWPQAHPNGQREKKTVGRHEGDT